MVVSPNPPVLLFAATTSTAQLAFAQTSPSFFFVTSDGSATTKRLDSTVANKLCGLCQTVGTDRGVSVGVSPNGDFSGGRRGRSSALESRLARPR